MRIAYLINQYPAVSHTFIRREIHALERQGLEVVRIALRGWDATLVDPADVAERRRTRYVLQGGAVRLLGGLVHAAFTRPGRLLATVKQAWAMARESDKGLAVHLAYVAEACVLRRWLAQDGASHLHAHFATNPAEIAMLSHILGGPAYSFTAHGSDIMDRPAQVGLPRTVGQAAFAVAVCSYGRSQIFKWIPHRLWTRVHVVRCGLERGYAEGAAPASAKARRLVCVGRLSKEKGQLLLVQALALARQRGGDAFELVLAGDGPQRPELEALARTLGVSDCLRITGWLDASGVRAELRACTALVVPSLSEGLPVVIMEAMACRRPVIAPYLAGIPELVSPQTGWMFPASDVEALADRMAECLSTDEAMLARMGDAASERVWRLHDVETEAQRLGALVRASAVTEGASGR